MCPSYVEPLAERVSEVATHRKCIDGDDATVNSVLRTQLASQPPHSNAGAGRAAACAPLRSGVVRVYLHSPATSTVLPAVLPQSSSPHDIVHPAHLALCCHKGHHAATNVATAQACMAYRSQRVSQAPPALSLALAVHLPACTASTSPSHPTGTTSEGACTPV